MKKTIRTLTILLLVALSTSMVAQTTTMKQSLHVSFMQVDYYTNHLANDNYNMFSDTDLWQTGWSVGYGHNLNNFLNLVAPLHIRKSALPLSDAGNFSQKESLLIGLDATLQAGDWDGTGWFKPYLLCGFGATWVENGEDDFDYAFPAGAGLKFRLGKVKSWNAYLDIQAQHRFVLDSYRNNWNFSIGLNVPLKAGVVPPPPPKDTDGDGITDDMDRCPTVIGTAELRGCPDTDGDGIADLDDECVDEPGVPEFKGCPDTDGDGIKDSDDDCPEVAGVAAMNGCPDSDSDGIKDGDDDCPTVAGVAAFNGCPDSDNDGLKDSDDKCPNEAGPKENNGCPYADSDGDGVLDKDDRCPNKAGPASNKGCPEIKVEDKKVLEFAAQNVYFDTNRSTIKSVSNATLDSVVEILKKYPEYSCSIAGHTDSIGNAAANQKLSENRAKACYDYLISKGIPASRLSSIGYGETQPVADNRFKDGREKNRRVEFNVFLK